MLKKTSGGGDRGIYRGDSCMCPSRRADCMMNCTDTLHWGRVLQHKEQHITVKIGDEYV